MVDFRYHLVSIIAVFLALAIGIVVGTAALNGTITEDLQRRVNGLAADKRGLESQVSDARGQADDDQRFLNSVESLLISGRLSGQRVVIVSAPGASNDIRNSVSESMTRAGATVTGRIQLRDDYVDPAKTQLVDELVTRLVPAGVALPAGTPLQRAAVELAAVLTVRSGRDPLPAAVTTSVLTGFREAGLISVDGPLPAQTASLAVVLVGTPPGEPVAKPTAAADSPSAPVTALARALDARGSGAVIAGPRTAADSGGLLAAARADGALTDEVSTVDSVDSASGRVATVYALVAEMRGVSGRYGGAAGSEAPLPVPSPGA